MRNQATNTAAASLAGCAAIYAIGHFLTNTAGADFSAQDHALRRALAKAAAFIASPLQRCYADGLGPAPAARESDDDRNARLMFAGLACDGGLAISGG